MSRSSYACVSAFGKSTLTPVCNPFTRHRGKFALAFLRSWIDKLAAERRRADSPYFDGLDPNVKISIEKLTLATLAARSDPPPELVDFLERVVA